tara:strand:- start:4068 stop:4376 length:309 start_codon:yes stop_codon:yes gene_type:complete
MIFLAKLVIYFSLSFFILCIPVNRSPLFFHFYRLGGKYVEQSLLSVKREIFIKVEEGTNLGKKFFLNSLPKETKEIQENLLKKSNHKYTAQEKELLNRVFNN